MTRRPWPVTLVAVATFASGLASLLQGLFLRLADLPRLAGWVVPLGVHGVSRTLVAATGAALMYLSVQLYQRRRAAWAITIVITAFSVGAHLLRGNAAVTALPAAATLVLLLAFRPLFSVRSEVPSLRQGIVLFAVSIALTLAYGTLGFWLLDARDCREEFHLVESFAHSLRELALVGNPDLAACGRHAHWFLASLRAVGLVGATLALYSLFRPVAYRLRTLPQERATVREILERHAVASLDFFKLWPDKSYYFSADRQAVIAYRTARGVAICLGDPVGPRDALEPLVAGFMSECAGNGWGVAFHQVLPDFLPMYRAHGLDIVKIGEEGMVDLERFCTVTVEERTFRRARRLTELGYRVDRCPPPHRTELLADAAEVSREWCALPGRRERGFTLGRFEVHYVAESTLDVLRDADGRLIAFVNEIPTFVPGLATIDLMRHRTEIPNRAMDFLFAELLRSLWRDGYARFSLGLAPGSGVGERPGASLHERAVHQVYEHLNRFFSYKGLRAYKSKFEPEWEERFLAYQGGPVGLVSVGLALVRVSEE